MKKAYQKPAADVVEFRFAEHIATSGCYWGSSASWTHGFAGCEENYTNGQPGWIGQNG